MDDDRLEMWQGCILRVTPHGQSLLADNIGDHFADQQSVSDCPPTGWEPTLSADKITTNIVCQWPTMFGHVAWP